MNFLYLIIPIILIAVFFFLTSKKKSQVKIDTKSTTDLTNKKADEVSFAEAVIKSEAVKEVKISFTERLRKGLSRSRSEVWGKVSNIFSGTKLDADKIEALEELLYSADIGPKAVGELITEITKKSKEGEFTEVDFKNYLSSFLKNKMAPVQASVDQSLYHFDPNQTGKTKVIMVVGVNGAGKTTTIGKLATKLRAEGASVVVGACDTFRAAAVDQLQVWCDRSGATMIRAREGANPSGVGYDALQAAINQNADYCILDTAGRLHTKENLMEELTKSKNVLQKLDPTAPHQVLLVIDAITGQNALRQAEEFHKALSLTGLIFTKCDGSSKAGSAVSIVETLKVPIVYIGVGETAEDLDVFNLDDYLKALLFE
jgi:fused signal recognition particle receptor